MKSNFKSILFFIILIAVVIVGVSTVTSVFYRNDAVIYSDIMQMFEDDIVVSYVVDDDSVIILKALVPELNEDGSYKKDAEGNIVFKKEENGSFSFKNYQYEVSFTFQLEEINKIAKDKMLDPNSPMEEYDYQAPAKATWWQAWLPYIIIGVVFIALWVFMLRQAPGGGKMNNFAKSKAKVVSNDKDAVKFADVAGADEEKAELEEVPMLQVLMRKRRSSRRSLSSSKILRSL